MQKPLPPGMPYRKGTRSSNTGVAAGEKGTFLRNTGDFAKRGWYFCGF